MERLRVITAARIHTMDPGRPEASAVAVSDGKIVSVGTLQSMQPWLRRIPHDVDDTFIDRVLMPGFIDPHTHLRLSGTYMGLNYLGPIASTDPQGKPIAGLPDRDAVLQRLKGLVSQQGDSTKPIVAWGYDPGMQQGHLDRDMLDAISTQVPVWVIA